MKMKGVPGAGGLEIRWVEIGKRWTAGDEGLKYLRRFINLQTVYFIKGAPVTDKAVEELQRELPNLIIQTRGAVKLGVATRPVMGGLQIETVDEDSAAEAAGLIEGDIIVKFDGAEPKTLEELVELIAKHSPGDKVRVEVNHLGEVKAVEVTLKEWH